MDLVAQQVGGRAIEDPKHLLFILQSLDLSTLAPVIFAAVWCPLKLATNLRHHEWQAEHCRVRIVCSMHLGQR